MRRQFAEIDDNGVVVEIHTADTKGNKGQDAKEPKAKINTKKPSHKVIPSQAANKGDRMVDGKLLRPLTKRA